MKVQQRGFRVWRLGKQVGEVLDQDGRGAQLTQFVGAGDLLPVPVGDVEDVLDAIAHRGHRDLADVDAVQRQRVGELVQEPDRVRRVDAQHGVAVGRVVVDLQLDGVEGRGRAWEIAQGQRDASGQLALGLAQLTRFQQT